MDGEKEQLKTRFAPTPSGYLHKGNLFSLLLTWLIARKTQGQILLRIDNLDFQRVKPKYVADIFEAIEWLGIDYDVGPSGVEEFERKFSQLNRMDLYEEALKKLVDRSQLAFNCQCSRSEILKESPTGVYQGTCLHKSLPASPSTSLRIVTPANSVVEFKDTIQDSLKVDLSRQMNHFVIQKKDGYPAYQLTSLIDDLHFGINAVVRGEDLINSTAAQLFLSKKLDIAHWGKTQFYHHPLLTNDSVKLSKSNGDCYLEGQRNDKSRETLIQEFCLWMSYKEPVSILNELLDLFEVVHLKQLRQTTD